MDTMEQSTSKKVELVKYPMGILECFLWLQIGSFVAMNGKMGFNGLLNNVFVAICKKHHIKTYETIIVYSFTPRYIPNHFNKLNIKGFFLFMCFGLECT